MRIRTFSTPDDVLWKVEVAPPDDVKDDSDSDDDFDEFYQWWDLSCDQLGNGSVLGLIAFLRDVKPGDVREYRCVVCGDDGEEVKS